MPNDMQWDGEQHPSSIPEEQGIHSRSFLDFFAGVQKEGIELHSFHVIRHNHMIVDCVAKPFTETSPHRIYSSAKGIQCLAALFLVQEGKLRLEDKVVGLFSEDRPEKMDPRMESMTVRDLLTMTNGHPRTSFYEMRKSDNWIRSFLGQPLLRQPGTKFEYNNAPPHLICCLPRLLAGQNMLEYLKPRFLDPLGIEDLCETCLDPAHPEDLEPTTQCLSPLDFAKFAQFFLQHGSWNGTQLLRADLCDLVGKRYFPSRHFYPEQPCNQYGFGLFCYGCSFGGYRFSGGYGQQAIVIPELDMACEYMANENQDQVQKLMNLFEKFVVCGCHEFPVEPVVSDVRELRELTSHYSLAPLGSTTSPRQAEWEGKTLILDENPQGIDKIHFSLKDRIAIEVTRNGKKVRGICGLEGEWIENPDYPLMDAASSLSPVIKGYEPAKILGYESRQPWLLSAAWTDENVLQINARRMDLMCTVTQTFTLAEKSAAVRIHHHFLPGNQEKNPDIILTGSFATL